MKRKTSRVSVGRLVRGDKPSREVSGQDYVVGFGRPPIGSRFKPGISGNAKGRPKGHKNLKTLIRQAMTASISVQEGSSTRRVSKIEGVVLRQLQSALKGDDRSAMAVIKMAMQVGLLEDPQSETHDTVTAMDEEILQQLLQKRKRR
jgi:Family of unknown function (DUF5681)